jgi:hypothetical protein
MENNTETTLDSQEEEEVKPLEGTDVVKEQEESTETQEVEEEESVTEESSKLESQSDSSASQAELDKDDESEEDKALEAMKKLRSEAKNLRLRLKDAEARIVELEASKTDEGIAAERDDYQQKYETLFQQHRTEKISRLVSDVAREQGAIEPDAVAKLIDQSKIEWNDDGEPSNVNDVVIELKNTYKRLFGVTGKGNAGTRNERGSDHEGLSTTQRLVGAYSNNDD